MLNNIDIHTCPICLGATRITENGRMICPVNTGHSPRHCLFGEKFEQIRVGRYLLLFTKKDLSIFEHKFVMSKAAAEIDGCSLLFKDLDTEDKIQEVLKNYKILS